MIELIQGDCLEKMKELEDNSVDSIVTDPPYGWSFMGKKWDYDIPAVDVWKEVLRVLKPGGHALVACGTRTQHRMAVNLEDTGFEIRDIVAWIYGSGFPKSLNIGKAVDKLQGNEREVVGNNPNHRGDSQFNNEYTKGLGKDGRLTKGVSEWEGWGTALKPAMELWTLCRKPLEEKTVAENVLKWGVGGINIDECRIGETGARFNGRNVDSDIYGKYGVDKPKEIYDYGRFPANIIHDGSEEVLELFPQSKAGKFKGEGSKSGGLFSESTGKPAGMEYGDNGSAARFFYCPKASKSERNKGLENIDKKVTSDGREKSIDNPFLRGETERHNNHPTVKPVALMRYLCRLITPPDGIVIDPFMGSGSTGIAAELEGFNFIGIELDPEYFKIAEARINEAEILNVK